MHQTRNMKQMSIVVFPSLASCPANKDPHDRFYSAGASKQQPKKQTEASEWNYFDSEGSLSIYVFGTMLPETCWRPLLCHLVQSLTVPFILSNHLCVARCAFRSNVPNGIVRYVWFDSKVSYQRQQVLRWWLLQGWQQVPLHCSGHGMCALLLFGSESLSAGLHRGW